jgi:hypothetical protein
MTAPTVAPDDVEQDDDGPDILHIICTCTEGNVPELALCGFDTTGEAYAEEGDQLQPCKVCLDLARVGCPRCGTKADVAWLEGSS